jgi:uncharacterized integral membrane protein
MRFLRGVIGAILLVLLAVFAVANRQTVTVNTDPLPFAVDLPLYLLVFLVFFAGLVLGALADRWSAWGAARRRQSRQRQQEVARAAAGSPATGTGGPGLPPPA